MHDERITLNAAELMEARYWLSDCDWHDVTPAEIIEDCSDAEIVRAVAVHFDGGLPAFIACTGLR